MKDLMNLTDLAVIALALRGGVAGLVMLGLWVLTDIAPCTILSTVEDVTGRKPQSLEKWVRANRQVVLSAAS
jgi:hypothetical protein